MDSKKRQATSNTYYPFVGCPKDRPMVLNKKVARHLQQRMHEKTAELKGEGIYLTVQPDPVHLFGGFPPAIAPYQIMQRLKGCPAHVLREGFSWLKSRMPNRWTRGYYIGTAGQVSAETIER